MKRLSSLILAAGLFVGGMIFAPKALAACEFNVFINGEPYAGNPVSQSGGNTVVINGGTVSPGSRVTAVGSCLVNSDRRGHWECVEEHNNIPDNTHEKEEDVNWTQNNTALCFFPDDDTNYYLKINNGDQDVLRINVRTQDVSDDEEDLIEENLSSFDFCAQIDQSSSLYVDCTTCMAKGNSLYTSVGCIRTDGIGLAQDAIRVLLGISGGVALMTLLAASFYFTTSQGDTNKVRTAKELITAAVSGLLFIIFSVIFLQFVGITILRIPGLG